MARSYDTSALCLAEFIAQNIEPGATLITDGWRGYPRALELLEPLGLSYGHLGTAMTGAPGHAHDYLPGVHRVASLLKRWLLGTHQGSVSAHQMDQYLAEFVFWFNRRASQHRGLLFWRLMCALSDNEPLRRAEVVGRKANMAQSDHELALRLEELYIRHKREREVLTSRAYRARRAARRAGEREAG